MAEASDARGLLRQNLLDAGCGPFGAVKEQAAGLYAQAMAERGFLTIAFDPSFTGESGGTPRLKKATMILSPGDANMYEGALFSYRGDFLDYLGLEDMGVFTAYGGENGSPAKLAELKAFGMSLK